MTDDGFWDRVHVTATCWCFGDPEILNVGTVSACIQGQKLNIAQHVARMAGFAISEARPTGARRRWYACHRCNKKNCVRPSHLYIATQRQNVRDAAADFLYSWGRKPKRGKQYPRTSALRWCAGFADADALDADIGFPP